MTNRTETVDTIIPATIPTELVQCKAWVAYAIVDKGNGKIDKIPKNPHTGGNAKCNEPTTWGTFQQATARAKRDRLRGVGFQLGNGESGIVGVDLDHCVDKESHEIQPWARQWVDLLDTYTEITQSGEGLRLFARGALPAGRRKRGNVEVYDSGKFLTVTGWHLEGTPVEIRERSAQLAEMHTNVFGEPPAPATSGKGQTARASGVSTLTDGDLIDAMAKAKNNEKVMRLFGGDTSEYDGDASRADLALCSHLAFYTGKNAAQMDRLFRDSGLYRKKWDEKRGDSTYGERTIRHAIERCTEVYHPPSRPKDSGNGAQPVPAAVRAPTPDARPCAIEEVVKVFRQYLELPDPGGLYFMLATIVANYMPGDPVWGLAVSVPGGGKTEQLQSLARLPHVFPTATLTEGALLSGTSKRQSVASAKGGLLREIGDFGIILIKDFGSILSLNKDNRSAILQGLREVYDGSWTRHVGTDGGRTLHWEGKVGMVGGSTPAIDAHHAVISILGERFIFYRLPEIREKMHAGGALRHLGAEAKMRAELSDVVRGLFAHLDIPNTEPAIPTRTAAEEAWLIDLACFTARCRSGVLRDSYSREVELITGVEAPTRIVLMLAKLLGALKVTGLDDPEAYKVVQKVAFDSMPQLRRAIIEFLTDKNDWIETPKIATGVKYPTQTTRRALEDLTCYDVIDRQPGNPGCADNWHLSALGQELYAGAITVPESRGGMH